MSLYMVALFLDKHTDINSMVNNYHDFSVIISNQVKLELSL